MEEFGGFTRAEIELDANESIFIAVGGMGADGLQNTGTILGGWNGGGNGSTAAVAHRGGGGGGATHIATNNRGALANYGAFRNEILVVAGGGRRWWKPIYWWSWTEEQMEYNHQLQHNLVVELQVGGGTQTAGGTSQTAIVTAAGFGTGGVTSVNLAGGGGGGWHGRRNRS